MSSEASGSVEHEIQELRQRVQRLEAALARRKILDEEWIRASRPEAAKLVEPVRVVTAAPVDAPEQPASVHIEPPKFAAMVEAASEPGTALRSSSLESRIASQWFNRIGILAVLIGMAWFLKLAFDNHWIGPLGRVLIGLAADAGLIAWSKRFWARGCWGRDFVSLIVGGVFRLPSDSGRGGLWGNDYSDGVPCISLMGAGVGTAGALCDCGRLLHVGTRFNGRES